MAQLEFLLEIARSPVRSLNVGGRVKYDVVREMRSLRRWSESLSFPNGPFEGHGYYSWKIPIPRVLVSPPTARPQVQAACAQVLIDAAERLVNAKPRRLEHARVFTIIGYPDLFQSEVCVFFDLDYFASFQARNSDDDRWTPKSRDSLIHRLALRLPSSFAEQGFDTFSRDDTFDPPYIEEGETWLIGEAIG